MKKILFGSAAALLIAAGVYFNFRMSETRQEKLQVSELTLKNLEAMGCDGSGVECDIFPDCQQGLMDGSKSGRYRTVGCGSYAFADWKPYCCDGDWGNCPDGFVNPACHVVYGCVGDF